LPSNPFFQFIFAAQGCGKSTLLKALGHRAVPIPRGIDIFFLDEEVEPSDTVTALDAVMAVDEQRLRLEKQADELNQLLTTLAEGDALEQNGNSGDDDEKTPEEQQEEVMEALTSVYERLDALDASTAEVRARSILKGLGFTHEMQGKKTRDFSGGWRMRVSLARALFIQPVWYVNFVGVDVILIVKTEFGFTKCVLTYQFSRCVWNLKAYYWMR